MANKFAKTWLAFWCALLVAFGIPAFADETADAAGIEEATDSVEQAVQDETEKEAAERRQQIMQEAVDALAKSKEALAALKEDRIEDALEALAVTTGKLELIVARDPSLALAPTDMTVTMHDIYGSIDSIQAAIHRAEQAIDDGEVQKARRILDGLGSEMVITVVNLPLATYPDAIKAITPLIDEGKIEEAKDALQAALNTLVLQDHVVPLPLLRSEALLEQAEELAAIDERSEAEDEELSNHLAAIRNQLKMAQLLGYGNNEDYETLYAQLSDIESRTADGQSAEGFFDRMKSSMSELWNSIFS